MSSLDPRALRAYLDVALNSLSNAGLVDRATDLLAEEPTPDWAMELAVLGPEEILDAHHSLETYLVRLGVLPDSGALRLAIRERLLALASSLETTSQERADAVVAKIEALFHVMPGYCMTEQYIPIVESPYPLSHISDPASLAAYIRSNVAKLVPEAPS